MNRIKIISNNGNLFLCIMSNLLLNNCFFTFIDGLLQCKQRSLFAVTLNVLWVFMKESLNQITMNFVCNFLRHIIKSCICFLWLFLLLHRNQDLVGIIFIVRILILTRMRQQSIIILIIPRVGLCFSILLA